MYKFFLIIFCLHTVCFASDINQERLDYVSRHAFKHDTVEIHSLVSLYRQTTFNHTGVLGTGVITGRNTITTAKHIVYNSCVFPITVYDYEGHTIGIINKCFNNINTNNPIFSIHDIVHIETKLTLNHSDKIACTGNAIQGFEFQFSGFAGHGLSGSPILDSHKCIIGIVTMMRGGNETNTLNIMQMYHYKILEMDNSFNDITLFQILFDKVYTNSTLIITPMKNGNQKIIPGYLEGFVNGVGIEYKLE